MGSAGQGWWPSSALPTPPRPTAHSPLSAKPSKVTSGATVLATSTSQRPSQARSPTSAPFPRSSSATRRSVRRVARRCAKRGVHCRCARASRALLAIPALPSPADRSLLISADLCRSLLISALPSPADPLYLPIGVSPLLPAPLHRPITRPTQSTSDDPVWPKVGCLHQRHDRRLHRVPGLQLPPEYCHARPRLPLGQHHWLLLRRHTRLPGPLYLVPGGERSLPPAPLSPRSALRAGH